MSRVKKWGWTWASVVVLMCAVPSFIDPITAVVWKMLGMGMLLHVFLMIVVMPGDKYATSSSPVARWLYRKESEQLRAKLGKLDGIENLLLFITEIPWPHSDIRTQAENEVIKVLMAPVLARLDAAQTTAELQQIKDDWQKAHCQSGKYDKYGRLDSRLQDRISREICAREHTVRLSETVRQIGHCATVPELVECALATNHYCHAEIEEALHTKAATLQLAIQS